MSTATAPTRTASPPPKVSNQRFAGYWALLRLALRRDRIKLPVWIGSIALMSVYFTFAIETAYPDASDLEAIRGFMTSPAGVVMSGPGYGMDGDLTHPIMYASVYMVWLFLGAALMSIFLITRHTRLDEESGRLELVRAGVVGRHAPLAVAATLAIGANLVLGLLSALLVSANPDYELSSSLLFGCAMGMVGLVFAGVAAVTAQLSEHGKSASGMASAILVASMIIRGAGDIIGDHGSWLSWFSPLAWGQQTRVFVDDRWWPMVFGLAMAVITAWIAYILQSKRDLDAGLLATRPGRARAASWLRSPFFLTARLERGSLLVWGAALGVLGFLYGALTDAVSDSLDDIDNEYVIDAMGGDPTQLVDGYLGTIVLFNALIVACYAILTTHRLTSEESSGRAELALSTATGRVHWMGATLLLAFVAMLKVLALTAVGTAVGALAVTGDWSYVGDLLLAHLIYVPGIAVIIAIAALGFSIRPGWLSVAWIVAVGGFLIGFLGGVLDLPGWVTDLSPFGNIALAPLESQSATPMVVLSVLAVALTALALVIFRRRDIATT